MKQAYLNLQSSAKRRAIEMTLTFEEFEKFCAETSYMELKGRNKDDMSIDRKDATKGYSYGNMQILTQLENGIKAKNEKKTLPYKYEKPPGSPF